MLGFDNLLYISIESKRVPEDRQSFVRKVGIGLAIFFRIALLFVVIKLIARLQESFSRRKEEIMEKSGLEKNSIHSKLMAALHSSSSAVVVWMLQAVVIMGWL